MRIAARVLGLALALGVVSPVFAGFSGTDVFLPAVGRRPGVGSSQWYAALWIHNPSSATANVTIAFLYRDQANPSPMTFHDSIPPGDSRRYPDAVATLFNVQAWGALRITSSTPLLAAARMYNLPAGGEDMDTQGQGYTAIPASFAVASGQSTRLLAVHQTNPRDASQFRYSFGWVETTGSSADVQVSAYDESGSLLARKTYPTTRAFEPRYYPIEDLLPSVNSTNVTLEVAVLSGSGRIIAVGSGVANRSNDATTFEMQFADSLLGSGSGISTVSHDTSLAGDGTPSSPLAIANGGVTKGKLAASGGTNGQVLSTDGSRLVWQNGGSAGFSLPYTGTVNTTAPAFFVENSGNGHGIYGRSTGGGIGVEGQSVDDYGVMGSSGTTGVAGLGDLRGVRGESWGGVGVEGRNNEHTNIGRLGTSGDGVYGESTNGYGVHGKGINVDGVFGESGAAGKSGVYAVNANPSGYAASFRGNVQVANGFFAIQGLAGQLCADGAGKVLVCGGSDARLKRDVRDLASDVDVLVALSRLRGVTFNWDTSVARVKNMGEQREVGVIAQEVEAVLPELVRVDRDGYRIVDYSKLAAFLIEVNKAQQARIEAQQADIVELRIQLHALVARIDSSAPAPANR